MPSGALDAEPDAALLSLSPTPAEQGHSEKMRQRTREVTRSPSWPGAGERRELTPESRGTEEGTMASLGRCLEKKVGGGGEGCWPKVSEQRGDKKARFQGAQAQ